MITQTPIQTNHGVSYPLVGPQRLQQVEVTGEEDDPAPPAAATSKRESSGAADNPAAADKI